VDISDSDSDLSLESFLQTNQESTLGNPNKKKSASIIGKRNRSSTTADDAPAAARKLFREVVQRERQAQKDRKKQLRKDGKEERARLREEAKQAKEMIMEDNKQRRGYYANREVCVLVDPVMMRPCSQSAAMLTKFQSSTQAKTKFPVVKRSGVDPRAIQFIRCRFQDGGAEAAQKSLEKDAVSEFEVIDRVLIVFDDMKDFLPLLHRDNVDDDDFPKLIAWLQAMKTAWQMQWNRATAPTVVILLNHQEAETSDDLFGNEKDALIWDAIAFLGILEGVECIPCPTRPVLWKFVYRMTIAISKAPYKKATTEIQCMPTIRFFGQVEGEGSTAVGKKSKKSKTRNESTVVDADHEERIQETWYRMLRAIPQVSAGRAASVVEQYPTLRSLWWAYQDPSTTTKEKELLLAWKLDTTCDGRHLRKLSTHIYRLLTSDDGGEKII
jgi:vacuolar-type H+-ATPase subunit H